MVAGSLSRNHKSYIFGSVLIALFAFRLAYGLGMYFWKDDELQIFLLGLEFFSSGKWPFFGPDVVHTNQQIAGALQSILVGGPLFVWNRPEAPYILLNVLSFSGLLVFGRWLSLRFKELPPILIYSWLMTLPWTMNISTHLYNPGYLLFSSCLFFTGCFEVIPQFRTGIFGARGESISWFLMGFALTWSMQLHLSWPLLMPFVGAAWILTDARRGWRQPAWCAAGALIPGALLVPTIVAYGPGSLIAPMAGNSGLNTRNLVEPLTIVARFISFGSYEIPRFLTDAAQDRLPFLMARPWLLPLVAMLSLVGVVQPLVILYGVFARKTPAMLKWLLGLSLAWISVTFLMSSRPPTARNFFILFPVAAFAAAAGMRHLLVSSRQRKIASGIVAGAIACQGMLMASFAYDRSLYLDRARIVKAIESRSVSVLGERRQSQLSAAGSP
ncbi:hypothetical protein EBZ80_00400 [bacterium]|nr:hypothetical protein [bacterium]